MIKEILLETLYLVAIAILSLFFAIDDLSISQNGGLINISGSTVFTVCLTNIGFWLYWIKEKPKKYQRTLQRIIAISLGLSAIFMSWILVLLIWPLAQLMWPHASAYLICAVAVYQVVYGVALISILYKWRKSKMSAKL